MLDTSPHRLVSTLEERIAGLETEFHDAYWRSQVSATAENERKRADLELQLRDLKGDPESLKAVEHALNEEVHDPVLRRQLEVLRLSFTANQMDADRRAQIVEISSSVESEFANYRPLVDGKPVTDNDIEHLLKHSDDQALRQRAWEASKEIGAAVSGRVRELARLRNAAALDLGYGDFYSMALDLQELPQEWLFETFAEVERLTDEPYRRWKGELDEQLRRRFNTDTLYPWHYSDPFFQQLPADGRVSLDEQLAQADASKLARQTFEQWDIDIAGVLEKSDLYPRPNKSQHAFCLDVNRTGSDVRILANIVPGERWVEIMLHECGHAAYNVSIDKGLPYFLRRPTHTFVTEAAAILSGRLARDPRWLVDVAGLDGEDVVKLEPELARAGQAQVLLFARWALAVSHFERDLYRDPEADLDARWWELVEQFQLVDAPPDRSEPDWAAKIHVASAPAYYSTTDGKIIWDFNTMQPFETVNGVKAQGGSLDAAGPVIAGGMVYTNSGYGQWRGKPGNVLLAFGLP